jgi:hypothetical protein
MSAELLREAAALMRERAEAATAGPWECVLGEISAGNAADYTDVAVAVIGPKGDDRQDDNAEHIASWHPAVALAVADWLEQESRVTCHSDNPTRTQALAVARAYLGRPA